MWMREAKELCPHLIVMPYEFDRYHAASEQVYRVLMVSHCLQQASVGHRRCAALAAQAISDSKYICHSKYICQLCLPTVLHTLTPDPVACDTAAGVRGGAAHVLR